MAPVTPYLHSEELHDIEYNPQPVSSFGRNPRLQVLQLKDTTIYPSTAIRLLGIYIETGLTWEATAQPRAGAT